ncbi:MAG TPA: ABC transporter permease subunit [Isosphaeraceae bacterium]|jgi:ABC-type transport system involved in multi-copper enzyme maturation permease subunit|nr:ABC transporter permease subunit [Isosphaeraceae bacterium]
MARLPGPGPVFEYEWRIGARRKQVYALRSLFVGALLVALWIGWWERSGTAGQSPQQRQAMLAMQASYAIVGTMLTLVLLVAPAATAGAICQEKARGTLAHMLVTDLTDSEIVLGKLVARLMPVLTLIGCALPVVLIVSMMGGVDPNAMAGAFLVSAAIAVLGCSLALLLSIRAKKTHEVLLLTYLLWTLWLLIRPIVVQVQWVFGGGWSAPWWLAEIDPFLLSFAPYDRSGPHVGAPEILLFVAGCLAISVALLTLAVRQVRRFPVQESSQPVARKRPRWRWWRKLEGGFDRINCAWARATSYLPGPSLDANPVLWREWHRNRPSRGGRIAWGVYVVGATFFTLVALAQDLPQGGWNRGRASLWVNGFQVAIGLLLLSVGSATSLAEERSRGSLDVLMTTPLSTPAIVWGKWLGTFRRAPWLAALPTLIVASLSWGTERWWLVPVQLMLLFSYVAFITSLGLALATWTPRLGRAVATCVAVDVLITVGFFFLAIMLVRSPPGERMFMVSPFGGPAILAADAAGGLGPRRVEGWVPTDPFWFFRAFGWEVTATLFYSGLAAALLFLTLRVFDRKLGRAGGPAMFAALARRPSAPLTFATTPAEPETH